MRTVTVQTLVVGSGAAALKAAVSLHALGARDLLIVTERWGGGASANAGSDKQTYYKVSLGGETPDSGRAVAETLFAGGCMHGDIALAEGLHSAQAFYHLVARGVPFPHDTYGAFPGYRTDHDPRGRGTSAGPSTSRFMVEALSREVRERDIRVLDRHQVIALLVDRRGAEPRVCGAVAIDLDAAAGEARSAAALDSAFVVFNARNVVLGVGGPGGLYADSVYPLDQLGSIGFALAAGAPAHNLTESQFGIASTTFRWNLSGSYQQVVPRYVSIDEAGHEREFLNEAFPDSRTLAGAIFRKGYQWPFDPRKVTGHGSSLIDLLVYRERVLRGRRVVLDFRHNFAGGDGIGPFRLENLDEEARTYLAKSGALAPTPIERLAQLNPPAIDLYRRHGIDLATAFLDIAVCAQHNNGGLIGDHWWQSPLRGLSPVGEANGSHGVYRPGGAALNAGQVGGLRAAMHIAKRSSQPPLDEPEFAAATEVQLAELRQFARRSLEEGCPSSDAPATAGPQGCPSSDAAATAGLQACSVRSAIQSRMSRAAGHVRIPSVVEQARREAWELYDAVRGGLAGSTLSSLADAFRDRDLALTHAVYLEAIAEYMARGGRSRGSALVIDSRGDLPCPALGEEARFALCEPADFVSQHILEVALDQDGVVRTRWTPIRPIPAADSWFESVWTAFRNDEVVR